jgi:signal transduction histidine kinase
MTLLNDNTRISSAADSIADLYRPETGNTATLVNGAEVAWDVNKGLCTFRGLPVVMMKIDSTLAELMSGMATLLGAERFNLALQAEGRKSVEADWQFISPEADFYHGFHQLHLNAAITGWGNWQLIDYQPHAQRCLFRAYNNWEGLYQHALGVCWGSGLLAGKFSGICTKLFKTPCWATQTTFVAQGAAYDEFVVSPLSFDLEEEIEKLAWSDQAIRADMAVAMEKLRQRERQLHQANRDLTRFAEVAAHHLMEPTRRFTSYTQRLRKQLNELTLEPELAAQITTHLDYLQADADRLYTLIHDIQLYLAADQPRGQVRLESVEALLGQLRKRLLPKLTILQVIITTENLPPVLLDLPRLTDLFLVILDNALCHGRPTDPEALAQIHIDGEQIGHLTRYRIRDNGAGIDSRYHERVFGIFERLTRSRISGSGIGLAIARRIVESRHGKIWLESQPQAGTTVIFELPDGDMP